MRILITGGLGYIGSHLCVALKKQGHSVDIVDKKSVNELHKEHKDILDCYSRGIYKYDISDDNFVEAFRKVNYDVIYHFGEDKVIHQIEDNPGHLNTIRKSMDNVIELVHLMRARNKVCRVVYSSSCAVYGVNTLYRKGKELGEKLLRNNVNMYSILRFGNPLGCTNGLSYRFFTGNGLAERLLELSTNPEPFPLICDKSGRSTIRSYVFINELINRCITILDTLNNKVSVVGNYVLPTLNIACEYMCYHGLNNGITKIPLRKGETSVIDKCEGSAGVNWTFMIKYIA